MWPRNYFRSIPSFQPMWLWSRYLNATDNQADRQTDYILSQNRALRAQHRAVIIRMTIFSADITGQLFLFAGTCGKTEIQNSAMQSDLGLYGARFLAIFLIEIKLWLILRRNSNMFVTKATSVGICINHIIRKLSYPKDDRAMLFKNSESPWVRPHLYFPEIFNDPVNVRTKFEVRSFTRSWDNRDVL